MNSDKENENIQPRRQGRRPNALVMSLIQQSKESLQNEKRWENKGHLKAMTKLILISGFLFEGNNWKQLLNTTVKIRYQSIIITFVGLNKMIRKMFSTKLLLNVFVLSIQRSIDRIVG